MSVTRVILPKLGLTMDEGKLVAWLKREGDRVEAGEVLFEVETDKATMEVEAEIAGFVRKLLVAAGETVPVTQVVALISDTADEPVVVPAAPLAPVGPAAVEAPAPPPVASAPEAGRVVASPAARKRAKDLGVDLTRITPARGARISIEDVEPASEAARGSGQRTWCRAGAGNRRRGRRRPRPRPAVADAPGDRRADDPVVPRCPPVLRVVRDVDMTAANAARPPPGCPTRTCSSGGGAHPARPSAARDALRP